MLLAIDAGNTNLVFALVEDGAIRARWRIATDARRTADEYAVWLHQLLALEGYTKADVGAVIIGTVVPRALHNLEVLASKYFGATPLVAGEGPVGRLKAEIGRPVKVVATGGLATLFDAHTKTFDAIEGDLTIRGLAMLHARSQNAP